MLVVQLSETLSKHTRGIRFLIRDQDNKLLIYLSHMNADYYYLIIWVGMSTEWVAVLKLGWSVKFYRALFNCDTSY